MTDAHDRGNKPSKRAASGRSEARVGETVAVDGFRALNAVDGLFLSAEHLNTMQDYARSLTVALATTSGPGVVHGLGVTLDADTPSIAVSPGLAISPDGQPLQLQSCMRIPLEGNLTNLTSSDGFWRVELYPASKSSGSAPVYGSLCNDGCADGTGAAIQPWRDEGVEIRFERDSIDGLGGQQPGRRRNWLASAYFERERSRGGPWLTPTTNGQRVASLESRDWDDGTPLLPVETGVPLALLQQLRGKGGFVLDMWAARRLVDGPQGSNTWRNRLAMRPWSIFLAQILQFEDELADLVMTGGRKAEEHAGQEAATSSTQETQRAAVTAFFADLHPRNPIRRSPLFKAAVAEISRAPLSSLSGVTERSEIGDRLQDVEDSTALPLVELPPAGYLSTTARGTDLQAQISKWFGVPVELRSLRADQVADIMLAAQHHDRIPLNPAGRPAPVIEILVPDKRTDKAELQTDSYGWVAFVRGAQAEDPEQAPEPKTEVVDVYLVHTDSSPAARVIDFEKATYDEVKNWIEKNRQLLREGTYGKIIYPEGSFDFRRQETADRILGEVRDGLEPIALIALTIGNPVLAAQRAFMLGGSLDSGLRLPTHVVDSGDAEAIVIVAPKDGS